jgi:hypothetical protein
MFGRVRLARLRLRLHMAGFWQRESLDPDAHFRYSNLPDVVPPLKVLEARRLVVEVLVEFEDDSDAAGLCAAQSKCGPLVLRDLDWGGELAQCMRRNWEDGASPEKAEDGG